MRRRLALIGTAVVALVAVAPTTWAGEQIAGGNWDGSALEPGPTGTAASEYSLRGVFRHNPDRPVRVTVSSTPSGDGPCAVSRVTLPTADTPQSFGATLSIPCNGVYNLVATAVTTENNAFLPPESASLDRRVAVSAPAPEVTGVNATGDDRSIEIRWDDMTSSAPDLSGYVVQRKLNDGTFQHLANVNADTRSYVDTDLPDEAGTATYGVESVRPAPGGEQRSTANSTSTVAYPDAPAPPTTGSGSGGSGGGDGSGGTDGSGGGATGGDPSGGSGSPGDGSTPSSAGGTPPSVSAPRVFSGTFLPPLLRPARQSITPTTLDAGFAETLPYGQGSQERALPGESMASITTDGQAGKGMAIPVATALVLAVWAVHLRMLARAARPLD